MIYKLNKCPRSGEINGVNLLNDDGSGKSFGFDSANTDYQAFLAWCAEGNTPEPADEQGAA